MSGITDSVSKTLYIPLYGKALVSRRGIILRDPKAEEIWAAEGFPLSGKSASKWLAYYMGMRSAVFDRWLAEQMERDPGAVVLHIGCGLDDRIGRVGCRGHAWFDIDFPDVIRERGRWFRASGQYHMLGADVRTAGWLEELPGESTIVVMEGVSMYLRPEELKETLGRICSRFRRVRLLMDCYTELAAKASRFRNPINDVGVTRVWGLNDPYMPEGNGLRFAEEWEMTPQDLVDQLRGMERRIFRRLYAGSVAKRMYRLYAYEKGAG